MAQFVIIVEYYANYCKGSILLSPIFYTPGKRVKFLFHGVSCQLLVVLFRARVNP